MLNAAIFFEPDGYLLSGPKLMGRQAAGNGFLRAAVAGRQEEALWAYTPHRRSADIFDQLARSLDAASQTHWCPADRLDLLSQVGCLYLPGPGLAEASRLRLRQGGAAYSLCGVTHTTASHTAMDSITGLLSAPVMPWDALICTSTAVAETIKIILVRELEYLRWRFGSAVQPILPQLPVIPLGVHCADYVFELPERQAARDAFGVTADEIVVLFVGRLSFHAKAHPHQMYAGLQAAAVRSGRKLVLIQTGWFANDSIQQAFQTGAEHACPDVRCLFVDGKDADLRRQSWAAADLFISLSDNIQETFGLTPIEAMAAGLPVVVSDWDGYKDTVREGVDGFRIPTWMPKPYLGEALARSHEAGVDNYDYYCGLTCQTVSVDIAVLSERLAALAADPDLRQRLGAAGRARALELYDWAVIYRRYQNLWADLAQLRQAAKKNPGWQATLSSAPVVSPNRLDPFLLFGHYPTALIQPDTTAELLVADAVTRYPELTRHTLFSYASKVMPPAELVAQLCSSIPETMTLRALAEQTGLPLPQVILAVSVLAKMNLVKLS